MEVARCGSIAGAAESLSFVPSAVSQQIDALERELGVELTARAGRGTVLTSAGRLLVEHAEELVKRLAAAEDAVHRLNGLVSGRLRIASFTWASATLLPGALAAVAQRHPGVRLTLVEQDPSESIQALKRYEVDLAVVYQDPSLEEIAEPGVVQLELMTEPMILAVPPRHPMARKQRVALESFADDTWVVGHAGTGSHVLALRACRAAGFEPRVAYTATDYLVALRLVAAGLGVSLVPGLAIVGLGEPVGTASLDSPPARTVLAAWREGNRSESVEVMVQLLTEEAKRLARASQ